MTYGSRMSVIYLTAVRVPPSKMCNSVGPDKEMPPQTITDPPPNGGTSSTLHCAKLSFGCRYTLERLSEEYRDTLDSSVKSTFAQSSTVQWMCSWANASCALRREVVYGGHMAGLKGR